MNSILNNNLRLLQGRFPQLYTLIKDELENSLLLLKPFTENFPLISKSSSDEVSSVKWKALALKDEKIIVPWDTSREVSGNSSEGMSQEWQIFSSKSGFPTGIAKIGDEGIYIHSKYDPTREGERFAQSCDNTTENKNENSCHVDESAFDKMPVFFGVGLGYEAIAVAQRYPQKGIAIIEPDIGVFATALCLLDFTSVFSVENCIVLVKALQQSVIAVLEKHGLGKCCFIKNKIPLSRNKKYFEDLNTLIQRNLNKDEINTRTQRRFGKLWQRNTCKNIRHLVSKRGIASFENMGKDLDACVLGAGPSLDTILPFIGEIKKRCLLIAVDTALRACLRQGVEPDFVFLSDPQYWNARHIQGLSSLSSILVTEVAAYPSVFRFSCKEIVLSDSWYPVGRYFADKGLKKGLLGTGGSIATSAWDFCRFCGCKRIFLAGVDLGFPQKKTHAKGSTFEEKVHTTADRLHPAETSGVSALFSAPYSLGTSYVGNPMITDSRMKLYAWWFESHVASHPEAPTYSLTKDSLKIPGIALFPLEELLEENVTKGEGEDYRTRKLFFDNTVPTCDDVDRQEREKKLSHILSEFLTNVDRIAECARQGKGLIKKIDCPQEAVKKVNEINDVLFDKKNKAMAEILFPVPKPEKEKNTDDKSFLATCNVLYQEIIQTENEIITNLSKVNLL